MLKLNSELALLANNKQIALIDPLQEEQKHWKEQGYTIITRIQNPPDVINSKKCPVCKKFIIAHHFKTIEDRIYLICYGKDNPCLRVILPQRGDISEPQWSPSPLEN